MLEAFSGICLITQVTPMKSKKLRILRQQASLKQNHRCYYCHFPMWDSDCEYFSLIHKIPLRLARYLKCTAEHLVARQDGGRDNVGNIAAACIWCNKMRHYHREHKAPDAATYCRRVSQLISLGRWHPIAASKCIHMHGFPPNVLMARRICADGAGIHL